MDWTYPFAPLPRPPPTLSDFERQLNQQAVPATSPPVRAPVVAEPPAPQPVLECQSVPLAHRPGPTGSRMPYGASTLLPGAEASGGSALPLPPSIPPSVERLPVSWGWLAAGALALLLIVALLAMASRGRASRDDRDDRDMPARAGRRAGTEAPDETDEPQLTYLAHQVAQCNRRLAALEARLASVPVPNGPLAPVASR